MLWYSVKHHHINWGLHYKTMIGLVRKPETKRRWSIRRYYMCPVPITTISNVLQARSNHGHGCVSTQHQTKSHATHSQLNRD